METNESKAGNFATLMGGVGMAATLRDGSKPMVKVVQLAIERYPELLASLGDEAAQLEIYCQIPKVQSPESEQHNPAAAGPQGLSKVQSPGAGVEPVRTRQSVARDDSRQADEDLWQPVPKGWAKLLTPESHNRLMVEAERLNHDFFSQWLQRHLAKMELLKPGIVEKLIGGLISQNTPPKPASPAA